MEPQEKIYGYDEPKYKCGKNKNCFGIVSVVLLVAFAVVIGLIIGAAISTAVLAALPAVIILAVVLGLLLILAIILAMCNKKDRYKKKLDGHC